jgi:hypothetical protein
MLVPFRWPLRLCVGLVAVFSGMGNKLKALLLLVRFTLDLLSLRVRECERHGGDDLSTSSVQQQTAIRSGSAC